MQLLNIKPAAAAAWLFWSSVILSTSFATPIESLNESGVNANGLEAVQTEPEVSPVRLL